MASQSSSTGPPPVPPPLVEAPPAPVDVPPAPTPPLPPTPVGNPVLLAPPMDVLPNGEVPPEPGPPEEVAPPIPDPFETPVVEVELVAVVDGVPTVAPVLVAAPPEPVVAPVVLPGPPKEAVPIEAVVTLCVPVSPGFGPPLASEQPAERRIHGSTFNGQNAARSRLRCVEDEVVGEAVSRRAPPERSAPDRRDCNEVTVDQGSAVRRPLRTKGGAPLARFDTVTRLQ